MKILIFIEVDVVVRHFIHNNSFDDLANRHQVQFVFSELGHKRMKGIDPKNLNLPSDYKHINVHKQRTYLWKIMYLVDQISWKFGKQYKAIRKLHRSTNNWKAVILLTLLGMPGVKFIFNRAALKILRDNPNKELESLLEKEKPDLIIHPCVLEGVFVNDLVDLSHRKNIPLMVIMNSWDNPSTKRAMIGNPDWLMVWGEQTKKHAIEFSKISSEKVIEFGSAQFEIYKKQPRIDKKQFLSRNKLPSNTPILLYAGSSNGVAEIEHLKLLDNAINVGDLPKVSVLYRPHPWGGGGKGGENIVNYPWKNVYIESSMLNYLKKVSSGNAEKYMSDYKDTHDVLCHIDALISPLSTIILEGAMHKKPVMCFVPNQRGGINYHFKTHLALKHFHDMFNMREFPVAYNDKDLILNTKKLLDLINDETYKERLLDACSFFVKPHKKAFDKRLSQFIEENINVK